MSPGSVKQSDNGCKDRVRVRESSYFNLGQEIFQYVVQKVRILQFFTVE